LDLVGYSTVLAGEKAAAGFTDPPYNLKINGHASEKGKFAHREFLIAAGEMTETEFTTFLQQALVSVNCREGALIYSCMDWRHMREILAAARGAGLDVLNLCVWAKNNGGMGALYRSRHELIFVFKNGQAPHPNNVQLGRFGRNRSNVWNYPGANGFSRKKGRPRLDLHPTAKPIALVADAILEARRNRAESLRWQRNDDSRS
jgi:DNA modification methylase